MARADQKKIPREQLKSRVPTKNSAPREVWSEKRACKGGGSRATGTFAGGERGEAARFFATLK